MSEFDYKKAHYVGIELIKRSVPTHENVRKGLFLGIRERSIVFPDKSTKHVKLIMLGDKAKPDSLTALNVEIYDILSIEIGFHNKKELLVAKKLEDQQKEAMDVLEQIIEAFDENGWMANNDPEIIGIYSHIKPPDYFSTSKDKKESTYIKSPTTTQTVHTAGSWVNHAASKTTYNYVKKMAEIKRSSELPGQEALKLMKEKVKAIVFSAGEVENETTQSTSAATKDLDAFKTKGKEDYCDNCDGEGMACMYCHGNGIC
ncbi:MAG: hypothetical protein PVG39_22780 [Desulfobacteraceae bacterium]|jgi:hypothetical protein